MNQAFIKKLILFLAKTIQERKIDHYLQKKWNECNYLHQKYTYTSVTFNLNRYRMKRKNLLILLLFSLLFINCSDDDGPQLSSENKIISFKISENGEEYNGVINQSTKTISVTTSNIDLSNPITPTIEISNKATISPSASTAQNFSQNVQYTVTAENGEQATYIVSIHNTPFSEEKKIVSFQFNIDNEVFVGDINHDDLTIQVDTYKDVSSISPIVEISENATISPNPNENQDFNTPINYTVTAQDGTSNAYTVNVSKREINSTIQACYVRATSFGRVTHLDLSQNYQLYLENDTNSYLLNYFDVETWDDNGVPTTNFYFYFDETIETAVDYKLRFKINGIIEAETSYEIDVLKENAPRIDAANQLSYSYNDTLILTGENLVPGLRIPANANVYQYGTTYVSVNSTGTTLTFPMTINQGMFPSWVGQPSPRATRVNIYHNGRYGDSIIVDFN